MSLNFHKKTASIILRGCGIAYTKLTARTVSFVDLARASAVFITAHGAKSATVTGGAFALAKATAKEHGFILVYD